jgi:uncharacterized phiE125 gp8 family phage protein
MFLTTTDSIRPPVSTQELADWSRLDSDDSTLMSALIIATNAVVSYLKLDLINRSWSLRYREWPRIGTRRDYGISPNQSYYREIVELPNANLQSIESVKINGVLTTDYIVLDGNPSALQFESVPVYDNDNYALEVQYTAGYGTSSNDVPQPIKTAILMAASYITEHRGGCNMGDTLDMSGAKSLLASYAIRGGIVL